MMAAIKWMCCVLLYVAVAADGDEQLHVDELLKTKVQETQRALAEVEQQLIVGMQVTELFTLEDTQMQLFSFETRAKLTAIQAEVKQEIDDAILEVGNVRRAALENVTVWMKSLQELQEATEQNKQTLQSIREQKEEQQRKNEKELELQERKRMEIELERQAEEMKKMREMEKQRELEEQKALEQLQALEKEKKELEEEEKQRELEVQALEKERQKELQQKRDLEQKERDDKEMKSDEQAEEEKEDNDQDEETFAFDSLQSTNIMKTVYVSMKQTLLNAVAAVYRQLVLPVVTILAFFLLLTVGIAKYNAMKQAQRNRRVLYSGYPASYRRNVKQQEMPATADDPSLEPRLRRPRPHRDPNGFLGN